MVKTVLRRNVRASTTDFSFCCQPQVRRDAPWKVSHRAPDR